MKSSALRLALFLAAISLVLCDVGFAQNFSLDARRIGLGGAGDSQNIASRLVEEQQDYRSIPVPLGIFQVLKRREVFDPDDPNFDPVRAIEYAASPLHWSFKRDETGPGNLLVRNIVDAELSRDLNAYRGFSPAQEINAQGLIAPSWGKTIRVAGASDTGRFHGVYVGVGPYLTVGTHFLFDQKLIDLLANATDTYIPNTNFLITDTTTGQAAGAITGGYRGHFGTGGREGLYIAANYNYLHGFHYDNADMELRFDTDSSGLVTALPATTPVTVNRTTSKEGKGFAIDAAMAFVEERWDVSFGVDGIGNRIDWKEISGHQYVLQSLFDGGDFITTGFTPTATSQHVTLPVRYSGSANYHADRWAASTEMGRGLQGFRANSGAEYKVGPLAFRGGARYSRNIWHGATGIGLNLTRKFGVDVAAFQTSTNIENERRVSIAVSLRINHTDR